MVRLVPHKNPDHRRQDIRCLNRVHRRGFSVARPFRNSFANFITDAQLAERDRWQPAPENLSLEQFVTIANWLADRSPDPMATPDSGFARTPAIGGHPGSYHFSSR